MRLNKFIIISILCLIGGLTNLSAQSSTKDVKIKDETDYGENKDVGRSLTPTIEAQINTLSRLLSFTFNEPVGTVTITVTNSVGETVASSQCNTTIQPFVQLFVPVVDDTYYIYINGDRISAYGTYIIVNGFII
jgi:hypothetical protein